MKGYGSKTHETDSQNSDTTAPSGRELYHLQFSLQEASPETFGYTLLHGVQDDRWAEMHMAELSVPEPSPFQVEGMHYHTLYRKDDKNYCSNYKVYEWRCTSNMSS
jgi:hypothetical protein